MIYIRLAGLCSEKMLHFMECHDDEVLIITICPISRTQSSFSSFVPLASVFGCLLALYLQTKKREGRPVSEAVSHFVYWHDGRSCAVLAGDFNRHPVWTCIVQSNCKWMH